MRIGIVFQRELTPPRNEGAIIVLLGGGSADVLARSKVFAEREGARVVTPLFEQDGALCAAYIEPGIVIVQRSCFPDAGFVAGEDATVFDTPRGKLALAVGADIFQPQYARLAAMRGCGLLLARTQEPLGRELLLAGPWSAAQANCLPVAVANETEGAIVLPCPLTDDQSGLGRTSFDTGDLPRAYAEFPVFDSLNARFLTRYARELT